MSPQPVLCWSVLAAGLLGVLDVMGQTNQDCSPAPPCDTSTVGETYRDPDDCTKFYMCAPDHEFYFFSCGEGQMFGVFDCVDYDPSGCIICSEPSCRFTCPAEQASNETEFIADANDCGIFHMCSGGSVFGSLKCEDYPNGSFFDGNGCQTDQSKCCNPCDSFYCWEANSSIPDPTNCHAYYKCNDVGEMPDGPSYCLGNSVFDPLIGTCSSGAPCVEHSCIPIPESCQDSLTCKEVGSFPACTSICTEYYFYCDYFSLNQEAEMRKCPDPQVIDPIQVACVDPDECPFTTTPPVTTPTITTTTLIPVNDSCRDSFTCQEVGVFAVCTNECKEYYFHCDYFLIGQEAEMLMCDYPYVLDPQKVVCVDQDECPFNRKASRDEEHYNV